MERPLAAFAIGPGVIMNQEASLTLSLCRKLGVRTGYNDIWGVERRASESSLRAILGAMGAPVDDDVSMRRYLDEIDTQYWSGWIDPVMIAPACHEQIRIDIRIERSLEAQRLQWELILENGDTESGVITPADLNLMETRRIGERTYNRREFILPGPLEAGYHKLEIHGQEGAVSMDIIATPSSCHMPQSLEEARRIWGPAMQLYALRSNRDWGIGDFGGLKTAVEMFGELGAGIFGLNPLHGLFAHDPEHAAPYSPSNRLLLNTLYIDVEAIAEFSECEEARRLADSAKFQADLQSMRQGRLTQYSGVSRAKQAVLRMLYENFQKRHLSADSNRAREFRAFQEEMSPAARQACLYDAMQEYFHESNSDIWGWPVWPEGYGSPDDSKVTAWKSANASKVEYFEYLQWIAESQLMAAAAVAKKYGVGLYHDMALGSAWGGSEVWAAQDIYARGVSIGAPPDDFNLQGQNWGLPPMIPHKLRQARYRPFIAMLRACMRRGGAIRIDHVIGLMRLFWIPDGVAAGEGAYVNYPFSDLLAIVALESHRNQTLVVGEDLGTVPEEICAALSEANVLSYRLLYFSKGPDGRFLSPAAYIKKALVSVTTHDLPTLSGYWSGIDIKERAGLNLFPSEEIRHKHYIERQAEKALLMEALKQEGLAPEEGQIGPEMTTQLAQSIHRFVARTGADVMMVQLEDILGQEEAVNLPGTSDERPNWRIRMSVPLEELGNDNRLLSAAQAIGQERGLPTGDPAVADEEREVAPGFVTPTATYRLQLNRGFTFSQARAIVPYLSKLGISHVYSSPCLKARPGSMHGYDIVDHASINPEIGDRVEFEALAKDLRDRGMGFIMDIVPNHMGVGYANPWWIDILENGQASVFDGYLDIDWNPLKGELKGKVLVPVLGGFYGEVFRDKLLTLRFDAEKGEFWIDYYEHRFPLDPKTYTMILSHDIQKLETSMEPDGPLLPRFLSLLTAFKNLPDRHAARKPEAKNERRRDKELHKMTLAGLCAESQEISGHIQRAVAYFNQFDPENMNDSLLHTLLERQAYRLAHWRVATDEVNYRRFFEVNDLIGLSAQNQAVADATHKLVDELLANGVIDGLRIDHLDGLHDPQKYLTRFSGLARRHGESAAGAAAATPLVYLEKILEAHEKLPDSWPVHGTTGYDFTNQVNGIFVAPRMERELTATYERFIGSKVNFQDLVYECKKLIMKTSLSSELSVLAKELDELSECNLQWRDFTLNALREALMEVVACFPVYRTYLDEHGPSQEDRRHIEQAISRAKKLSQAAEVTIFDFIRSILLMENIGGLPERIRVAIINFAKRFQQYTPPVMAKGLEDTAFYVYARLTSLNEVGGDPSRYGVSMAAFHKANEQRRNHWPLAMLATSTHDTKRSEDARARINVISEIPDLWRKRIFRWSKLNRAAKRRVDGELAPSRNDEYIFYQALLGVWPEEDLSPDGLAALRDRMLAYMTKAVKEAKIHTSWINENPEYEKAVSDFVSSTLSSPSGSAFLADFIPFQKEVAAAGLLNSFSQLTIKLTSPGVPDIYQGCELMDFSLVDPDNRRPVDYEMRARLLDELERTFLGLEGPKLCAAAKSLWEEQGHPRMKLYITWRILNYRSGNRALFTKGAYQALETGGLLADHICAFARSGHGRLLTIAPRWTRLIPGGFSAKSGADVWGDTWIQLPANWGPVTNLFTGESVPIIQDGSRYLIMARDALANFPTAALVEPSAVEAN